MSTPPPTWFHRASVLALSRWSRPVFEWGREVGALAYRSEGGRDLRIDFLRGFAVLAMVIDHLAGPSLLYAFTGGNRFFTSAGEGFVVVSGLVVGMVYRALAQREGLGVALRRLMHRAWQLYVLAVGLTLVVLPASEALSLAWAQGVDLHDPLEVLWGIFTLHRTYYLVDIPLLYALLLLAAPLALVLLTQGYTWIVLAASWLLWGSHQVFPESTDVPWPISGNYVFFFSSWQVLFFTAMALGYHRDRFRALGSPRFRLPLLVTSGLGFLGLLALFRDGDGFLYALQDMEASPILGGLSLQARLVASFLAKGDVGIGRIVASAIVFLFLFLVTSQFWRPLRVWLGWLMLPLGQNSLYAYSAHVLLAVVVGAVTSAPGVPILRSPVANAVFQVAGLALIWYAIRSRVLYPTRANQRWWMLSPAPIALALLLLVPLAPAPRLPIAPPRADAPADAAARTARAFGTPIPRQKVPDAAPATTDQRAPTAPLVGVPKVSPYVGAIQGAFREVQFQSAALDRKMSYFVYLPPNYGKDGRSYPVLYLLHGASGSKDEWPAYGLLDTLDRLITAGELNPLIVVMPQGDDGYWMNHAKGGRRWGDYVAIDLVHDVDASFRTLTDPDHRAIGGLSMGGFGALHLAFSHPDTFRSVGGHSPSLQPNNGLVSAGTPAEYAQRDPIQLAAQAPGVDKLRIWIDAGSADPWLKRDELLHTALTQRGITHQWNVGNGGHDGQYWRRNLEAYLRFYDQALNRRG